MKKYSFTAQELFCMAYLKRKQKMYGIPSGFECVPQEKRHAYMQDVIDSLISEQVAAMDMDGQIMLQPDYDEFVHHICDCSKCLIINTQYHDRSPQNYIFWFSDESIMMAEVLENHYLLSKVEAAMVSGLTGQLWNCDYKSDSAMEAVIPQIAVTKAKRFCADGNLEDAIRILRQNGADEQTAWVIVDGLIRKADYLGVLYMDLRSGNCRKQEKVFLASRGVVYRLSQTVVNFRTCSVFTGVDKQAPKKSFVDIVDAFLMTEQEDLSYDK